MVYWLKIIYWLLLIEVGLRCVYFWQLKEYRWDRFKEFLFSGEARRYFLPSRHFLRPRLTVKSLIIFFLSLIMARQTVWWFGYLFMPIFVAFAVALINPISDIFKWLVIAAAKIKLVFFHRRLIVIGITGSYGKTATKEILAYVLKEKFRTAKTLANNNTLIGVAKTILSSLKIRHEVFVVEMGAYKRGEIKSICNLVRPKIGILTGINEQHIGLFGSMENIIKAKSELLAALPKDGLAVINGTNPITKKLKIGGAPAKYYQRLKLKTNLLGEHQQLNMAAAVIVAKHLGLSQGEIEKRLLKVPQFKTAIAKQRGLNGALMVIDSYNSNRDGFLAAIEFCRGIKSKRKILITPGISELGKLARSVHEDVARVATPVFDHIYITKVAVQPWFTGAELIGESQLLEKLKQELSPKDLVLLEGRLSNKFVTQVCGR
jgi:UDP-N-acetylmuramoyl-tripeptide--D-alanyl-D-alanine ligase